MSPSPVPVSVCYRYCESYAKKPVTLKVAQEATQARQRWAIIIRCANFHEFASLAIMATVETHCRAMAKNTRNVPILLKTASATKSVNTPSPISGRIQTVSRVAHPEKPGRTESGLLLPGDFLARVKTKRLQSAAVERAQRIS